MERLKLLQPTCDCGRPLTVCSGCAVEDYQAAEGIVELPPETKQH
jgi:hypothetical protein